MLDLGFIGRAWHLATQRRVMVTVAAGICGLVLSASAAVVTHRWAGEKARDARNRRAAEAAAALHEEFSLLVARLQNLEAAMETFEGLNRSEFQLLVRPILQRDLSVRALEWIPRISHEERAAHQREARDGGLAGYEIWEEAPSGHRQSASPRDEYFPIYFAEPSGRNLQALGFDLASEAIRESALRQALKTGEASTTSRLRLAQETGDSSAILIIQPVFEPIRDLSLSPRGTQEVAGFMVAVYRVDDLIQDAFDADFFQDFRVRVFDLDRSAETGPLFDSTPSPAEDLPLLQRPIHGDSFSQVVQLPGRQWRLDLQSRQTLGAALCCTQAWAVFLAGLLLTGSLCWYLESMRRADGNLRQTIVNLRSTERELFEEKERAHVTLRSIADGVVTTDPEGRVQFMNPVAERLTGWPMADAKGKELSKVVHLLDEENRTPVPDLVSRCLAADRATPLSLNSLLISRYGKEFAVRDSAAPIRDQDGEFKGVALVLHDATENRRMVREIAHRASHDVLTGLVNRREFEARLQGLLREAGEDQSLHALCYLDLDHFKIVNDTAGHQAGDELLKQLAGLLHGEVRRGDTLARLGGDEFGLLLRDCPPEAAQERARSLVDTLRNHRFHWEGRRFEVGASVGVVPITGTPDTIAELLSRADIACYSAKEQGRNQVCIYSDESGELDLRRKAISRAADLTMALETGRFRLFAQPIYSLNGKLPEVSFYEVLLRLEDGNGTLLSPAEFIPSAESFGLMGAIDRWVVEAALDLAVDLLSFSSKARISINLSGNSLAEESLLDFVYNQIRGSKLSPERVCFEITETAAIRNLHHAAHFISELKKEGCRFALDDFGSGLASFSYLKELPIDYLKIDGGFVRNMNTDAANRAMVAAIHQIGQVLGLGTIAEHVASDEVVTLLRNLGVEYAQGYALGRPRPMMHFAVH